MRVWTWSTVGQTLRCKSGFLYATCGDSGAKWRHFLKASMSLSPCAHEIAGPLMLLLPSYFFFFLLSNVM